MDDFNLPYLQSFFYKDSQFSVLPKVDTDIVFMGDSLTQFGLFNELFPEADIKNRGIGGEHIFNAITRIDNVIALNPKKLFILYGANDMYHCPNVFYCAKIYEKMIILLKEKLSCSTIIIQSALPIRREDYDFMTPKILQYNKLLLEIAQKHNCEFVDLYSVFADSEDKLKEEFTMDGVHLTGEGYLAWKDAISYLIRRQ